MKYNASLDGIRALAVLPVLAFHSGVPGFGAGFFGVDVFFVLSGYLITQILMAEHERIGRIRLTRFYVRRLRRLWPAMLTMLAVFLLVAPWAFTRHPLSIHVRDAAIAAAYMSDYARTLGLPPGVLDHLWSLAVEEHFYLAWPLMLLAIAKLPRQWGAAAIGALFIAVTVWRVLRVPDLGWNVYHRFDTHSSGLFLGCLLGFAKAKIPGYFATFALAGFALMSLDFAHKTGHTARFGFTVAEILAAVLVAAQPKWLGIAPMAWLGRMSYGLYLWHYLLVRLTREAGMGWEVNMLVATVGGLALAALSYYTIEKRFRSLAVEDKSKGIEIPVEVRA